MRNRMRDEPEKFGETWIEFLARMVVVLLVALTFPIAVFFCFRVVDHYKRAIILRFGKVRADSPAGPGIIWIMPFTDRALFVDLRTHTVNLPSQEILTKDSVTVNVDAVMHYNINRPVYCLLNVQSHRIATEMLATSVCRNILGAYSLTELLSNRHAISQTARKEINDVTLSWGVDMQRVEIKDVILPHDLQRAMAAEAEGTRIAKAKIIESHGEIKAAESLREASRIMVGNPQIMLLRYLQTLNFIATDQQTSIFFPFPMELPDPQGPSTGSSSK